MICLNCSKPVTARHFYASGQPRCWARVWTRSKDYALMGHFEAGKSDGEIALLMGMTENAVHLRKKKLGLSSRTTPRKGMTARQVADRLGVPCSKTIARWITTGLLTARQAYRQGPHRVWFISEQAVLDFLSTSDHWHEWEPERITDPAWRRHADTVRGDVRFITLGEAARRFSVEHRTVHAWDRKGWIRTYRRNGRGNRLVRVDDVERLAANYVYGDGLKGAAA